jgi:hypothetical protein
VFSLKTGYRFKNQHLADPQVIGEALEKIRKAHGDELEKRDVVQEVREAVRTDRPHPLRQHFTEDLEEAAYLRWLDEAGDLIASLLVIDEGSNEEPRIAYYSASSQKEDVDRRVYHARDAIDNSRTLQRLVLEQAERDLLAWERRYSELADLCREIQAVRTRVHARVRHLLDDAPDFGYQPHV